MADASTGHDAPTGGDALIGDDASIADATFADAFRDASVAWDVSVGDATFAADFASRVRMATAQVGTSSTCASPLPAVPVASADDARAAVRALIAGSLGVAPEALSVTVVPCGLPSTATCANRFLHDVYKSAGTTGDALYPLAEELESRGTSVEETIWIRMDASPDAVVCISGIVDGLLVGVVFFNGRQDCP